MARAIFHNGRYAATGSASMHVCVGSKSSCYLAQSASSGLFGLGFVAWSCTVFINTFNIRLTYALNALFNGFYGASGSGGRGDYASARIKYAAFYHLIDALLLTNTFLILGCGLNDPNFQLMFENFSYRFPNSQPHYMAYADSAHEEVETLVRETRKLKFFKYSKAHGHKELEQSLEKLVAEVEKERVEISINSNW
jgi:hypothetical protein